MRNFSRIAISIIRSAATRTIACRGLICTPSFLAVPGISTLLLFAVFGMVAWNLAVMNPANGAGESKTLPLNVFWERDYESHFLDRKVQIIPISDWTAMPDGGIAMIGFGKESHWLIRFDRNGNVVREIWGAQISGSAFRLTATSDGGIYVAGNKEALHLGDFVFPHDGKDIFVARMNSEWQQIWDRTFGGVGFDTALSVQALPDDSVVVMGRGGGRTRLSRLDHRGKIIWDRKFGGGARVKVAYLEDRRFIGVELEADGNRSDQKTRTIRIGMWVIDGDGMLVTHVPLRKGIISGTSKQYQVAAGQDGFYAAMVFNEKPVNERNAAEDFTPLDIIKFDLNGNILWQRNFPEMNFSAGLRASICAIGLAVLPDGDLLLACAKNGRLELLRLKSTSGDLIRYNVPYADCHNIGPDRTPVGSGTTRLMARQDGTVIIANTSFRYNGEGGCLWLGRVTLPE